MDNETRTLSIGMIAEGIAIVVAIGFVISVIYDWGYVYAIGIDLMSLPTTISDHLRTGVIWFPYLLAFVFVGFAVEFQFRRVERGLTEQEIIESSKNPEKLNKFREGPWKLIKWTAPLAVFNYILIGDILSSVLPLMLSIVWMGFSEWCYSAPLIQLRRSWESQAAFTFLPIIFILAFFSGYNAAVDASIREPEQVSITLSKQPLPVKGNLLREFERGVFFLSDSNNITFIPWGQIESIRSVETYKSFRGILCEWFQICTDTYSNKDNSADAKSRAAD